jgi:hypothetical protein
MPEEVKVPLSVSVRRADEFFRESGSKDLGASSWPDPEFMATLLPAAS